jgi:signal transduction histidine kinase
MALRSAVSPQIPTISTGSRVAGLLLAGVVLGLLECLSRTALDFPSPAALYLTPILLTLVLYAAFRGGTVPGLATACITVLYAAYYLSVPGEPLLHTPEHLRCLLLLGVTAPAAALMTGHLHSRAHRGALAAALSARGVRPGAEIDEVEDELAAQLADMTRLHELSTRLSTTLDLQPVLEEVLAAVTALQDTNMGVLMLYDAERRDLRPVVSVGFSKEYFSLVGRIPEGAGACGMAVAERSPVMIEDVESEPSFSRYVEAARLATYRAVYSIPLLSRTGDVVGTIDTCWSEPHRLSEREISLVQLYARQAGWAIDNARLFWELQETDRRKDEFLAMLAHELRNPLGPILNALQLMRGHDPDPSAFDRARGVMERQVKHMARLVDDLLDVARITRGKVELRKEPVPLARVVQQAVEVCRPLMETREHQFTLSMPEDSLWLEADATRIEQVLVNLLNNAAKYTEPGGRLSLSVAREASRVVIRVRDNGIGVPADVLPHVFDLFVQSERSLDRSQGGLGIGLTLVRSLVQMHGGTVSAYSAGPGQGSEFIVRFPLSNAALRSVGESPQSVADAGPPAGSRRVLVVEDNLDAAETLNELLELWGHEPCIVHDGEAAIEAARVHQPDLVLLDIGLPGMDGYSIARALRRDPATASVRLIALTGYGQEEDRRRSHEAGFDVHLTKPVDPAELQRLLAAQPEAA